MIEAKLKTLKDIRTILLEEIHDIENTIFRDELKAEAIKWI